MPAPAVFSRRRFLNRTGTLGAASALAWPLVSRAQSASVRIGQSAPLSGPMAGVLAAVLAGEKLALDEYNQRADRGQPIELERLDDGYDPRRTGENAAKFVEQKVAAMFGTVGTAQTAAALKVLTPARVPLIASYTGTPALRTDDFPLYFTTQANYLDESSRIIRHLVTVQAGRVAVLYQDDAFGKSMLPLVQKAAADAGATVAIVQAMEATGQNAAEAAQAIAQAKPQSVLLLVAGPGVVAAVRALRQSGLVSIYTYSLAVSAAAIQALGRDAVGLAVVRSTPYPWRPTQPLPRAFNAAAAKQQMPIDYDHYLGYINGRVLIEAVRAAGPNPTPAAMIQGMQKLGRLDMGGYVLQYGPGRHHGSTFTEITILAPNGRFIR